MKVLVTGARGLLGSELVRTLPAQHSVIPLTRAEADLTQEQAGIAAIVRHQPDYVIHAAAWTDVNACEERPVQAFAVNAEATRHVACACQQFGIPLLYVSTDYVFDGRKGAPYTEQDAAHPVNVYGASKLAGENYVQELLPEYCIVRTAWLFGPARTNFVDRLLASDAGPLEVIADQVGSPTYTVDLAEKIAELVARRATGLFHVTNQGGCSRYQVAEWLAERLGWRDRPLVAIAGTSLAGRARRPHYSALANEHLVAEGFAPLRTWQEALAAYLLKRAGTVQEGSTSPR